ncbi:MAG: hypothetical protein ACK5JD_17250 [Mangrovibacterium sp.]
MKNLSSLLTFLVCIFLITCKKEAEKNDNYESYINEILDCMNYPRPQDAYNYQALPGMEIWNTFRTTQEMIEACQVPNSILVSLSTEAVFQSIWEYPFFFETVTRPGYYQHDFENVIGNTNSFVELKKREDAALCLFSRLLSVDPLCTIYSRGLELFISQPLFLEQLSENEKKRIVEISLKNDLIRQQAVNYEEDASREITWLLIARTLWLAKYEPFVNLMDENDQLKRFLETSMVNFYSKEEYDNFFQLIVSNGKNFIQK